MGISYLVVIVNNCKILNFKSAEVVKDEPIIGNLF